MSSPGKDEAEEIMQLVQSRFHGCTAAPQDYNRENKISSSAKYRIEFNAQLYSDVMIRLLRKFPPEIHVISYIANLYLMNRRKPVIAVIPIDRQRRIRNIRTVSEGYAYMISEIHGMIASICKKCKVKRCVIIYNYRYKSGILGELSDLDKLYHSLMDDTITMIDAVRCAGSSVESMMSPYNSSGYE